MKEKELPRHVVDMTGRRYGRLVALEFSHIDERSGSAMWRFHCDCGIEFTTYGMHVRSGKTRSCGCLRIEECRRHAKLAKQNWMIPVVVVKDGTERKCESLREASEIVGIAHSTARIYLDSGAPIKGYTLKRIAK